MVPDCSTTSRKRWLLINRGTSTAGTVIFWSNPLLTTSPGLRMLPLASARLAQPNVLSAAAKCPPALTWMAELPYPPDDVNVEPVTNIVPLTRNPNAGEFVSVAWIVVPVVTTRDAPTLTVNSPVAWLTTYRWLAVVAVPRGERVADCPLVRLPDWRTTSWKR